MCESEHVGQSFYMYNVGIIVGSVMTILNTVHLLTIVDLVVLRIKSGQRDENLQRPRWPSIFKNNHDFYE